MQNIEISIFRDVQYLSPDINQAVYVINAHWSIRTSKRSIANQTGRSIASIADWESKSYTKQANYSDANAAKGPNSPDMPVISACTMHALSRLIGGHDRCLPAKGGFFWGKKKKTNPIRSLFGRVIHARALWARIRKNRVDQFFTPIFYASASFIQLPRVLSGTCGHWGKLRALREYMI